MTSMRSGQGSLRLAIVFWLCIWGQQGILARNITVSDTDPSISYQPLQNWFPSTNLCSLCLVGIGSYHEAIRWGGVPDADDTPSSPQDTDSTPVATTAPNPTATQAPPPSANVAAAAAAAASNPSPPPQTATTNEGGKGGGGGGDGDGDENGGDGNPKSGKNKRRSLFGRSRFLNLKRDPDDSGITDAPMSLAFNFTGTAVYLFGLQPQGVPTPNGPPTNQDLTFVLDNQSPQVFQSQGSPGGQGFSSTVLFSAVGLTNTPHQLVVNVGLNSTFLFQQILYTSVDVNSSGTASASATPLAASMPSQTTSVSSKKHNIATFAGAVGGSVGVLGLFSLGLAISIIRRRYLAAKRDRMDHESLHTNGSDDSPNMSGPAPFVPRFFPDTEIPSEPPAYLDAVQSRNGSTLLDRLGRSAYPEGTFPEEANSYADIPPDTPPPLEETVLIPPPPPFPLILPSNPSLPSQASDSEDPSIPPGVQVDVASSLEPDSVGTTTPVSPVFPELVPLLQSAETPIEPERPRSRISIRSNITRPSDPPEDPPATSTAPTV